MKGIAVLAVACAMALLTPLMGAANAAGFGAASQLGQLFAPSVELSACRASVDQPRLIWLAAACDDGGGGGTGGSGGTGGTPGGTDDGGGGTRPGSPKHHGPKGAP